MKKQPAHIKNRKKKHDVDYISMLIFIIIIAILVYFAYELRFGNDPDIKPEVTNINYNGFEFSKDSGIWYTQIEKNGLPYIIMTEYSPLEVENVSVSYKENYLPGLTKPGNTIYLSFDPNEENKSDITVAAVDFAKGLSIVFRLNVVPSCLVNATGCTTIQTCNSTKKAVIELIRDDNARVEYEGNCLRVYGKDEDLIKAVDRVLFEWYEIIKVDETGQVITI